MLTLGLTTVTQTIQIGPWVHGDFWKVVVFISAYVLTVSMSGYFVTWILNWNSDRDDEQEVSNDASKAKFAAGRVIGKCENIITVTLMVLGQESALGLIVAAKALARKEEIKQDPEYYLGGTLINLMFGMLIGLATRVAIFGI